MTVIIPKPASIITSDIKTESDKFKQKKKMKDRMHKKKTEVLTENKN